MCSCVYAHVARLWVWFHLPELSSKTKAQKRSKWPIREMFTLKISCCTIHPQPSLYGWWYLLYDCYTTSTLLYDLYTLDHYCHQQIRCFMIEDGCLHWIPAPFAPCNEFTDSYWLVSCTSDWHLPIDWKGSLCCWFVTYGWRICEWPPSRSDWW